LWLLAAILFTLPLAYSTQTQDQFELPKQLLLRALSSLSLGTLLALLLADPGFRWRRSPLDWPVLAWSLWLIVTTVHSISPAVSWRGEYENFAGCLTQLNYSAVYFLVVQFAGRSERALLLARALLASSLGAGLYALMQALQRDLVAWSAASVVSDRFFGSLGNPNFLGGLMAMAIVLKLALILGELAGPDAEDHETGWRLLVCGGWVLAYLYAGQSALLNPFVARPGAGIASGWVLALWLAALVAAPLLRRLGQARRAYLLAQCADLLVFFQVLANTGTRGAFLGLMAGVCALALGRLAQRPAGSEASKGLWFRAGASLALLAVLLAAAFAGLGSSFRERTLASLRDPGHALEVSRLQIWAPAVRIWSDHPLAGTGLDTFKTVFPAYSQSRFAKYDGENVSSRTAHCEPLQILATQGSVGLCLWLWLCSAAFLLWWRRLRQGGGAGAGLLPLGLGALAAAYLAQNLVSFGVAGISVPFWAALGMLFCTDTVQEWGPFPWRLNAGTAALLGAGLAVGGVWLDAQTLRADLDYAFANEIQSELPSLDKGSVEELRSGISFALNGLGSWQALSPDLAAEADGLQQELAGDEAQLQRNPASAAELRPNYLREAGVLLAALAVAHLERAVALCPGEVKYRVYLGLGYEELFRRCAVSRQQLWFQKAVDAYTRSTELNPGNSYYRGNLGRIWGFGAEAGNADCFEQAQKHYMEAVALAPVTKLFYENLLLLQARYARVREAGTLMDTVEAVDKELAPTLLMEAASTFFQWRTSGQPAWDPKARAAALAAAVDWSRRALALAPDKADYAFSLAVFEDAAGRRADSIRDARRALELDPGLDPARKFLAGKP
jgi:tetratricopeptide (TPR) repeat protein